MNVLLDEFAFHPDSHKIWAALFPTITRGYKLQVISTPQGKQNKFYELCTSNEKFSKHKLTIYDAVAQGLELRDENGSRITPEDLRQALGDEDAWQQEYMVEFLDEATAFLTYETDFQMRASGYFTDYAAEAVYRRADLYGHGYRPCTRFNGDMGRGIGGGCCMDPANCCSRKNAFSDST